MSKWCMAGGCHCEKISEAESFRAERDELAAQVEVMRAALSTCFVSPTKSGDDFYFNLPAVTNALVMPNTATAILRKRDAAVSARTLLEYVKTIPGGSSVDPQWIADDMRRLAAELEAQHG